MEINDFVEPEIAVTAAVVAAIFSPRARKVMRKGLVYGTAGVLAAGDAVTSFARSVGQGVQQASETVGQSTHENGTQARMNRASEGTGSSQQQNATDMKVEEKAGGKSA